MPVDTARLQELIEEYDGARHRLRELVARTNPLLQSEDLRAEIDAAKHSAHEHGVRVRYALGAALDEIEGLRAKLAKFEERPVVEWREKDRGCFAARSGDARLHVHDHGTGRVEWQARSEGAEPTIAEAKAAAERAAGLRGER